MVLEERVIGSFHFPAFADHFQEGDSDTPVKTSNVIECLGRKLQFTFFRKNGKLDGRMCLLSDGRSIPLRINKFQCHIRPHQNTVCQFGDFMTFLPTWCRDFWDLDADKLNPARIAPFRFGWVEFPLTLEQLRAAAQASDSGVLKLQFEITASVSAHLAHESCLHGNLQEVIASLADSPSVRLLGPNGQCVALPKALLCAHSPVLRAALASPMEEAQSQTIKIVDLKQQAFQDFSTCLCAGGLPSAIVTDWERLVDLLAVADKYAMPTLVDACISLLSMAITMTTVAPLMKIADAAGFIKLLRCLLYYCLGCSDRMTRVIDSDEYTHFSADLLRAIAAHRDVTDSGKFLKYPHSFQYLEKDGEFDGTTDWSKLSSSQLRRACFERDLSSSGTSAEMILRLSAPEEGPEAKRQRCE